MSKKSSEGGSRAAWMTKEPLTKPKCKKGAFKSRKWGQVTGEEYRGMGLTKPKSTWGLIQWGTCRSPSCSPSDITAGRRWLRKIWACCLLGWGTWRWRTQKRMQYLKPSPLWSLLIRSTFRNHWFLTPMRWSGARKTYLNGGGPG